MTFNQLFNFTVVMTPKRTLWVSIVVAVFFTVAALTYDSSALIDAPVRAWLGMR